MACGVSSVDVKVEVTAIRDVEAYDSTVLHVVIDWPLASCDGENSARKVHTRKSTITSLQWPKAL